MARTLAFLEQTVVGLAGLPQARLWEAGWDPALVHEVFFGGPREGA